MDSDLLYDGEAAFYFGDDAVLFGEGRKRNGDLSNQSKIEADIVLNTTPTTYVWCDSIVVVQAQLTRYEYVKRHLERIRIFHEAKSRQI